MPKRQTSLLPRNGLDQKGAAQGGNPKAPRKETSISIILEIVSSGEVHLETRPVVIDRTPEEAEAVSCTTDDASTAHADTGILVSP